MDNTYYFRFLSFFYTFCVILQGSELLWILILVHIAKMKSKSRYRNFVHCINGLKSIKDNGLYSNLSGFKLDTKYYLKNSVPSILFPVIVTLI